MFKALTFCGVYNNNDDEKNCKSEMKESLTKYLLAPFPTGLSNWESGEEVAEGQPSLSNGKIANSQLFSHPPIWFSLLSVPNKCTIGKFSGY